MTATATPCTYPRCRRKTKDVSARCQDHRDGVRVFPAGRITMPTVAASASLDEEVRVPRMKRLTFQDGATSSERWTIDYRAHRDDGPATIDYRQDGSRSRESWWRHGDAHRIGGPSETEWDESGHPTAIRYYVRGKAHRIDGPAITIEKDNGETYRGYVFRGEGRANIAEIADRLLDLPTDEIEEEIMASSYRPLLEEGHDPREIAIALGKGVTSAEGVREVLAGAPVEWVRNFEESAS